MKYKTYIILTLGIGMIALVYFLYPKDKFEGILTNEVHLSPNNKEIIFVYEKDDISNIYLFKVGGKQSKILARNSGYNLSEPSFTADGKKIIYRVWKRNNPIIHIFICNADGSKSKEIYKGNLIFSPKFSEHNPEEIYFIKATEYSNHSPLRHSIQMEWICIVIT